MRKSIWLLASCALLAGCGGGNASNGSIPIVGGAPAPTPSPTATPTPSPSPAPVSQPLNTGEVKPTPDALFISATLEMTTAANVDRTNGVITGGTTSNRVTTFDTPRFSGSYNAGYHLSDSLNSAVFGEKQLSLDTTSQDGNGVVLFEKFSAAEDYLALYQETTYSSSVKGSGYTTARYGGIGGWQHTTVNGSSRHTRLDYFAFGSATPIAAMPHSGVVQYKIMGSGNYATDTDLWFLAAGSSDFITVDFGAGTVSGSVSLAGENFYQSQVGGIGSFPVKGNFSGNSMTSSFSDGSIGSSGGVPGQFHIVFVGPRANELIITYVANDGTQAAVGASVGIVDPYAL